MSDQFPLFEAAGDHRELGRQHGEQAREQLTGFLDYLAGSLQISSQQLRDRALAFQPLFERDCPHLLDEVYGLAEGSGLGFADALAVQIRGELGHVPDGACTTFVVGRSGTADGRVLIGQTSDMAAEINDFCYMLRVIPVDKPAAIMWTFGGMLGYHGLNEHGVAHFANSLGGGPEWKFALPHYPLKRMILEQDSLENVRGLLGRIPVCSNGNYVLCDGRGNILDVELTSDGPLYLEADREADQQGFLAHSNHFLCSPHDCRENLDLSLPDSFPRLERMNELIGSKYGQLTAADCREFLSDHAGPSGWYLSSSSRRKRIRHRYFAGRWTHRCRSGRRAGTRDSACLPRKSLCWGLRRLRCGRVNSLKERACNSVSGEHDELCGHFFHLPHLSTPNPTKTGRMA